MILSNSSKFTLYILFEPTRAHVYSKSFCNNKLFFRISSLEKPWCPWMFLPPRKSSPLYFLPANLLTPQGFPPAFLSIPQNSGGWMRLYQNPFYLMMRKNMWIHIWLWILVEIKKEQNTLKKYSKNEDLDF